MKYRKNYKALDIASILIVLSLLIPVADAQKRTRAMRAQTALVEIGKFGYEPATFSLRRGIPARVTFLRLTEQTCATEVVFADYGIRRDLPLNQAVVIQFTPKTSGEFSFTCGMNMHRGRLIVR